MTLTLHSIPSLFNCFWHTHTHTIYLDLQRRKWNEMKNQLVCVLPVSMSIYSRICFFVESHTHANETMSFILVNYIRLIHFCSSLSRRRWRWWYGFSIQRNVFYHLNVRRTFTFYLIHSFFVWIQFMNATMSRMLKICWICDSTFNEILYLLRKWIILFFFFFENNERIELIR